MRSILDNLIHLEMIKYEDNTYIIKNWNEYQSADKYEKVVEQNRERQRRFRDKNKEENNVTVTLGNGTEENKKKIIKQIIERANFVTMNKGNIHLSF